MLHVWFKRVVIVFCTLAALMSSARALVIDISDVDVKPIPVLLNNFKYEKSDDRQYNRKIQESLEYVEQVVYSDLKHVAFIEAKKVDLKTSIRGLTESIPSRYSQYQILIKANVVSADDGNIFIEFAVEDLAGKKNDVAYSYKFNEADATFEHLRNVAHDMSNEFYKYLTGQEGYFRSKIVYVHGNKIHMSDYDFANTVIISTPRGQVFSPKLFPDGENLAYVLVDDNTKDTSILIYNFKKNKHKKLIDVDGIALSPTVSRTEPYMLFSIAKNGSTNIYEISLTSGKVGKITDDFSINVSSSYSTDGKYIVFNSDRSGTPQLFVYDRQKKTTKQITHGPAQYYTPSWAPGQDLIAFTEVSGGKYFIGVMDSSGNNKRIIANDAKSEGPVWAPNGRVILYNAQGKRGVYGIYFSDVSGAFLRSFSAKEEISYPFWSLYSSSLADIVEKTIIEK